MEGKDVKETIKTINFSCLIIKFKSIKLKYVFT